MKYLLIAGGAIWLLPLMLFPQIPYLTGWPVGITGYRTCPIQIADIDDDGQKELIVSDDQPGGSPIPAKLYVFAPDGTIKTGWPIPNVSSYNAPAIADIDDDGKLEILSIGAGIHLYKSDGTLLWEHLYTGPIFQGIYAPSNATIADIDNDGNLEIVVTCTGAVFVFDALGNVRPGWPVSIPPAHAGWGPPPIYRAASIGDIDNDGLKEIIFGTGQGQFYCLKPDGTNCPGFPKNPPSIVWPYGQNPILYDLNGDGFLELLIDDAPSFSFRVYDHLGNVIQSIPINPQELSFGDPNKDGVMDVGFKSGVLYHLIETAGFTDNPNFPIDFTGGPYAGWYISNCAFANIMGDSKEELISGSGCCGLVADGRMFALDMNGAMVSGFPTGVLYHRDTSYQHPAVADVDGNGTLDFCTGSTNNEFVVPRSSTVYCWDTGYPYNLDNVDWAMDGFDLGHTGRWRRLYQIDKAGSQLSAISCQGQANPCYLLPDGSLIPITVTAVRQFGGANPTGQDVRYSRTLGCGNYEGSVVDNGDGTYTRMLRAPTGDCVTDVHAWVNEFKLQDCQEIRFCAACVPPSAFNLLSPPNGATNQLTSLNLDWDIAVGATSYDVYFGANPAPPLLASAVSGPPYAVSGLAYGQIYYWTVIAKNIYGTTTTATWSFIVCLPPSAFSLLFPANGATNVEILSKLIWNAAPGAVSYTLYLGTATPPPLFQSGITATEYSITGLLTNTKYYWRVEAVNACGVTSSSTWSFTTACPAPGAFDNPSPANGASGVPLTVDFTWQPSAGADRYQVYFGTVPSALVLAATVYDPRATISGLAFRTIYYWKIIAKNSCGQTSGPVWSFITQFPIAFPRKLHPVSLEELSGADEMMCRAEGNR